MSKNPASPPDFKAQVFAYCVKANNGAACSCEKRGDPPCDTIAAAYEQFTAAADALRNPDPVSNPETSADDGQPEAGVYRHASGKEIWSDCPVVALGVDGDSYIYLDVLGQVRHLDNHTRDKIRSIFGARDHMLRHNFPRYGKEPEGGGPRPILNWDQEKAANAMVAACTHVGPWNATGRVRGSGAWTDAEGQLIWHCGDAVLIDGEEKRPGLHGDYVYSASPAIPRPADRPQKAEGGPGDAALELFSAWSWRRADVDPTLVVGMICAQMVGGALDWRPTCWLTGDKASGKSTAQKAIKMLHGGEGALLQAVNTTEAGIRSCVGWSSLPVAVDELEPNSDDPRRVNGVIELARVSSSGGYIFRGGADQKGTQQKAYSCFLFSSILIPKMKSQDRSRLVILDLDRLPKGAKKVDLDSGKLARIGRGLRRRLVDHWESFPERLDKYQVALARAGHEGRGCDTYGTLLALADLALSDDLPSEEAVNNWADKLSKELMDEIVDTDDNAVGMLSWLLGRHMDPFRRGEQFTVYEWLCGALDLPDCAEYFKEKTLKHTKDVLSRYGLRVEGKGATGQVWIANKAEIEGLLRLFEGSDWAGGVWKQAADRISGAKPGAKPARFGGVLSRYTIIPAAAFLDHFGPEGNNSDHRPDPAGSGERDDPPYSPSPDDFF